YGWVEQAVDASCGEVGEPDEARGKARRGDDFVERARERPRARAAGCEAVGIKFTDEGVTVEQVAQHRKPEERARKQPCEKAAKGLSYARMLSLVPERSDLFVRRQALEEP